MKSCSLKSSNVKTFKATNTLAKHLEFKHQPRSHQFCRRRISKSLWQGAIAIFNLAEENRGLWSSLNFSYLLESQTSLATRETAKIQANWLIFFNLGTPLISGSRWLPPLLIWRSGPTTALSCFSLCSLARPPGKRDYLENLHPGSLHHNTGIPATQASSVVLQSQFFGCV